MSDEELAKDLGPLAALTIGVGTMIGAGIFVLPGEAAAAAGPAVALSFVAGGLIALFTAISASELGTAMPKAGGAYYYVNHALGPLFGSIAGWGNWVGLAFASAFYTLGFGKYLATFVGVPTIDLGLLVLSQNQVGALFAGIVFIVVNYVGAKETGRLQNVIVVVLVGILTLFSILGFFAGDFSTLTPFFPEETGGAVAIMPATALIFVSYLGFAQITTVAEEIKNPGRNLPLAVIGSVALVTTMYAAIMVVLMGVVNWDRLAPSFTETPVLDVAAIAFGQLGLAGIGIGLLTFAGLLATASSANASILASSRINFAMGRDKLVSPWLNEIHGRFATPYRSIATTGAIILGLILVGDVTVLAKAGSVLHLVVYALLNASLIVMRQSDNAEYDPDFTAPLYPFVPILGMLTSLGLIAFMDPVKEVGLALVFVLGGVVWYFAYARSRADKQGVLSRMIMERSERMPDTAVAAAETVSPDGGDYRVMVPLANPAHQENLVKLGGALAKQRGGSLDIVHIVTVPDQMALQHGADRVEDLDDESEWLLEQARKDAEPFGIPIETHTIISHESFEAVFDAARQHDSDLTVMGWGSHGAPGRAESTMGEIIEELPSDFLVFRDRGFDPSRILLPTAGGPDSDLSGDIAAALRDAFDAEIELLHVTDDQAAGEDFLTTWATEHDLADATLRVETGDPETIIEGAAEECSLLVLGATERGIISRLVRGTVVTEVADEVDCSVLLAERAGHRSIFERLFGRR